ncbi:MAG: multidrug transporter [Acidobacteria bacterium]|nr:MAG: multidrug transporter [Acidobacteriota bacterium]
MNLTKLAIEKNRITFVILAIIILSGLSMYQTLSRDSMPPYTVRVATIITTFPGAGPERVEMLVTDKIEKKVQEVPEVKEISSTSRTGLSVVTVTLKEQVEAENLQTIWDKLKNKLETIDGLPRGVNPRLESDDVGVVYGIVVGLISDGYSYAEMKEIADDIRDDLIKLKNAAKVELGGVQDERVFIDFDEAKLAEYHLTATLLQSKIAAINILESGGQVNLEDQSIILEPTGNFASVDDIRNTFIPVGEKGQLVQLRDIASIQKGYIEPPQAKVSVNGMPAISFSISLIEGSNIIQLGEEVDELIARWNEKIPIGLSLKRLASMDIFVQKSISDFINNLLQSVLIVMLVMLVFLGLRTGLIVAGLIPMVILMTLMSMGLINMGLNQVTLAALIMALGMMVDNAIVISESIIVKMEQGIHAKEAAIQSCSELSIPLLISTLTTSAAFLSFYLAESVMGDIMGPIFVVISLALLSSWVLSLSVTAMLCALFLKVKKSADNKPSLIDRLFTSMKKYYKSIIMFALKYKFTVTLGVVVVFFLSLVGFTLLPFVFFPDSDRNMITIDVNLPMGTRINRTEAVVKELEEFMTRELLVNQTRKEGIRDWSAFIGQGPASYDLGYSQDEAKSSYAHFLVNTSSFEQNSSMINRLDEYCFLNFPNAEVKVSALGAGGSGTPIEVKVSGPDPDVLSLISETIKTKLSGLQGTKNVKDDWGPKTKKFVIQIDGNKAQTAGISNQDIATSLKTSLDGFNTGEYREEDKAIPILLKSENSEDQSYQSVQTMDVFSQTTGKSVPLMQVAEILPQWQYAKIKRLNLDRSINVCCELTEDGNASQITSQLKPWLKDLEASWPEGFHYQLGGDDKQSAEEMGAVMAYLPMSGFAILFLLILQFNSVRKTLMVLSTIPLGIIGVVLGLMVLRSYFGFMAFLGLISLAGIVINNAIVLIDRIELELSELGRNVQDAVIAACLQRFRPILLTTFTTSLGLIPLYVSGGLMWEPMAASIMIGLLVGTIITLVFIPVLYSILYRVDYKNYTFNKALLDE